MTNKFIKKTLVLAFLLALSFNFFFQVEKVKAETLTNNNNNNVEIIFFGSPTCPHCLNQEKFLSDLKIDYPEIEINEYTLSSNTAKINQLYLKYNVPKNQHGLVPITFMANTDTYFLGFNDDIARRIESHVKSILSNEVIDDEKSNMIKIPFMGEVDLYNFSLPALAIILGIVDGFNVCSLGALIVILGLVMVLKSRKRIILVGGMFLLITTLTYGLLIFMWHQFFTVISPYIKSMELLIGILSLIGGIYLLREFIKSFKEGATCSSGGIIAKLSPRVEKVFNSKKNMAVLIGVVALFAMAVTIIEFPCSAFLPVLFTSILVESGISTGASLSYIGLFLLFYMLDELIIFLIAVFTMRIKIVSPKFINFFTLLASIIFLFLGSYYIYRIFM